MDRRLRVVLVSTAPERSLGSMGVFPELVSRALLESGAPVSIEIVYLSPRRDWTGFFPAAIRRRLEPVLFATRLRRRLPRKRADLIHFLDGSRAYLLHGLRSPVPVVVTAHDLIPLLQMEGRFPAPRPGPLARWLIRRSVDGLGRADMIIAVSKSTRDDLADHSEVSREAVRVVHPSLRHDFSAALSRSSSRQGERSGPPFVLHVGGGGFYKNRPAVVRIVAQIRRQHPNVQLVFAGDPLDDELERLVAGLGLREHVRSIARPTMDELAGLYRSASLLLFPSLYEGFGWPPLEAMAAGCPVICSDAGSLPEVAGDAALMAAPDDEETLAAHCLRVLERDDVAGDLGCRGIQRASEFTIERMGMEITEVYRAVLPVSTAG